LQGVPYRATLRRNEIKVRFDMASNDYMYIIVGGGLAGASAVEGIREVDESGSLLMIGGERHLPYDRPPLSKKLWLGKKKVEDIFIHDGQFYKDKGVDLALGTRAEKLDPLAKSLLADDGKVYRFKKLLLATGGSPRRLPIPGGDVEGICYYRYLDDYLRMRRDAKEGGSATIVGGGFIGSEIAAALTENKVRVTMVFPEAYLCSRVFSEPLGMSIQDRFRDRGIVVLSEDRPASFRKEGDRFLTVTEKGGRIESDLLIVGIGIVPSADLAAGAGLRTANGVAVDEYLRTSDPDIYAAGDNAFFPYQALGRSMRIEHWDNALNQGRQAGRNMAGAKEEFTYMPYFFSDLFEFGYEAVGEVSTELDIFADWQKENDTGVVYYLRDGRVRGVMMCNVWDRVEQARELIQKGGKTSPDTLRGAIR
jgi:3-phenylpropionate/trans-cinnamate dioxygenase ferredoxin reductase subunit